MLFSHQVMSDSLRPHELQHIRLPCPSLSPGVCWNSCPLSQWCHPTISSPAAPFSSCLQFIPSIRVFSDKLALPIRRLKDWSFSFSISPSNEYSGSISFRIDWFNLFIVKGTLKSLLQLHSSKTSILQCSAFFMVQLSHLYMTTGETIALTRQNFSRYKINIVSLLRSSVTVSWKSPSGLPWHRPTSVAQGGRASLLILFENATFSTGPPSPLSVALPISAFVGLW